MRFFRRRFPFDLAADSPDPGTGGLQPRRRATMCTSGEREPAAGRARGKKGSLCQF